MTDEQLEAGIEAIQAMLARREAGQNAVVIEGVTGEPETPPETPDPPALARTRHKAIRDARNSSAEAINPE